MLNLTTADKVATGPQQVGWRPQEQQEEHADDNDDHEDARRRSERIDRTTALSRQERFESQQQCDMNATMNLERRIIPPD